MRTQIRKREAYIFVVYIYIFYHETILFIRNCNLPFFLSFLDKSDGDPNPIDAATPFRTKPKPNDALSTFTNDGITSVTPRAPRKLANKPTDYR